MEHGPATGRERQEWPLGAGDHARERAVEHRRAGSRRGPGPDQSAGGLQPHDQPALLRHRQRQQRTGAARRVRARFRVRRSAGARARADADRVARSAGRRDRRHLSLRGSRSLLSEQTRRGRGVRGRARRRAAQPDHACGRHPVGYTRQRDLSAQRQLSPGRATRDDRAADGRRRPLRRDRRDARHVQARRGAIRPGAPGRD